MRLYPLILTLFLFISACGGPHPGNLLLQPSTGPVGSVTHVLKMKYGSRQWQGLGHLENDGKVTSMAMLTAQGQKLFSLTWNGEKLQTWVSPLVPKAAPVVLVLRDLQWALWPDAGVEQGLPRGWHMHKGENSRRYTRGGRPILRINLEGETGADPFKNSFEIINLKRTYRVQVSPAKE